MKKYKTQSLVLTLAHSLKKSFLNSTWKELCRMASDAVREFKNELEIIIFGKKDGTTSKRVVFQKFFETYVPKTDRKMPEGLVFFADYSKIMLGVNPIISTYSLLERY